MMIRRPISPSFNSSKSKVKNVEKISDICCFILFAKLGQRVLNGRHSFNQGS